jgi:hypothetical protein
MFNPVTIAPCGTPAMDGMPYMLPVFWYGKGAMDI